jgi:pheromone shutdown protein TraB
MVQVFGTSHVSQESIEMIDRVFEEEEFNTVALELDPIRLNAMLNGDDSEGGTLFLKFMKFFQNFIGKRTGVMPGQEMLYAYNRAVNEGKDVLLIDQDIRITMSRFNQIRRKEKAKAVASMTLGMVLPGGLDVSKIPDEEQIDEMVDQMRKSFPGLYRVLFEERNAHMINALEQVEEDTVAFVGAAHRKPVQEGLE